MTLRGLLGVTLIATAPAISAAAAQADTPTPLVPLSTRSFDGPTDITLTTEDEVYISATFFPVEQETPPAVILVHDVDDDRGSWTSLAQELAGRNIAVLTLDLRGHGGSKRAGTPDDAMLHTNDVRAGIRFLREREDIDGVRVAVIGAGYGANVAAVYGVDDHLLVGVALLSGSLETNGLDAGEALHAFGRRPTFLAAAKSDKGASGALPVLEKKAQGEVTLHRADGSARGLALLDGFQARGKLFGWLDAVFDAP